MRTFGLLGKTLTHSLSKNYFEEKFAKEGLTDCQFHLFEIENINLLPALLEQHPDICGFTVTIPYKQQILPYLDRISDEARAIGAVNAIKVVHVKGKRQLWGFNTDVEGFRRSLSGHELPAKALVLGSGGAAAAILYVLKEKGIEYLTVSRTKQQGTITYGEVTGSLVEEYPLIINCTPVGTLEDKRPPLPYEALTERNFLYDLVYNPSTTSFMQAGIERNAQTMNGLPMLHLQADAAWEIWNAPIETLFL